MPARAMADTAPAIFAAMQKVEERSLSNAAQLDAWVRDADTPFVVRGLVADWPLVKAGKDSPRSVRDYLVQRARPVKFAVTVAAPEQSGRIFYDEAMAVNFRESQGKLADIFSSFDAQESAPDGSTIYLSSIDMPGHFDGLTADNPAPIERRNMLESIWIGTATRIGAHNDFPHNIACCAVGKRRFTLFPPDQYANLYLGPLDNTPAGRAVSMVDFHNPDFAAHPRFANALEQAQVAELEPGDALFIPSMWWHHVEGLAAFNILVNYWWRDTPRYLGQPQEALNHAILAIRDLPPEERAIWRDMFDHYVFTPGPEATDHIPEGKRGILDPLTAETASRIRAFLLRTLNR